MALLLDLVAIAAVVLAMAFLLRPNRRSGCADCGSAQAAQGVGKHPVARVSVDALRVTARKADGGGRR
jgi:hypothetical protein